LKNAARLLIAPLALCAGTVFAQAGADAPDSIVQMYGMAMPFFDNAKTRDATTTVPGDRPNQVPAAAYTGVNDPSRNRITVGTSHWGFRGYEKLGTDLRLVWQMESAFQIDQNTGPGIAARDNKVGLRHEKWGEIFFGQWDTPYKYISLAVNPIRAGYVFDRTPITGNPGMGVPNTTTQFTRAGAKPDASFDRRQGNSVQYWSPNWGGLTFRLMHSTNEGTTTLVTGGPTIKPVINALSLQYDLGTLSVRYSYEEHRDYFGMTQLGGAAAGTATNPSSKDKGQKIVVLWTIGNTRITGMYELLDYKSDDSISGNINKYKRNAWYGVLEQKFSGGKQSVWISYGRANDGTCERIGGLACATNGLGAEYYTLGYIYRFSRRTEVFAAYYRLNNKTSAQYSPGPTVSGGPSVSPGADTVAAGVGIQHFF
jgi:predicted porin